MNEFKVGDAVRVKDDVDNGYYSGQSFTVSVLDFDDGTILVTRESDGVVVWFRSFELERAE